MLGGSWRRCWLVRQNRHDDALPASLCWLRCQIRLASEERTGTWQVSSFGRVKTLQEVIHHGRLSDYGYRAANIKGKSYCVHRLVARAFHGPPPTAQHTQVNHLDSNRENNCVSNLAYVTPSENANHARAARSWTRRGGSVKEVHCRRIGAVQWSSFPSQSEAARLLGLSLSAVSKCCRGLQPHVCGYQFEFAETVPFVGELWQAARYPGIAQAISNWQVSNLGRVKTSNGRTTFGSLNNAGYCVMRRQLESDGPYKQFSLHRLVVATFLGQPISADLHVNHLDGNRSNNCVENLEYATPAQNVQHAHSLSPGKVRKPNRWKPVRAREVGGSNWIHFESLSAAVAHTGVPSSCISRVCRGHVSHAKTWEFKYVAYENLPDEEWREVILDWSCPRPPS
mmetsp:Transcript_37581/g.89734  ORF Transcript_37581/g.89734 Transcript_37581/m.89734 type:complete len:397 (+) Transcript_37581:115-1305(+)